MPHITDREGNNAKRKHRLAQLSKGPGTFTYDGSHKDTEAIPMPLVRVEPEIVCGSDGLPELDSHGRAKLKREGLGKVVLDTLGRPVMGGKPRVVTKPIEVLKIRGMEFPKGKPVHVANATIALKLRGMRCFEETAAVKADVPDSPDALAGKTVAELKALAKQLEIELPDGANKAAIVEILASEIKEEA